MGTHGRNAITINGNHVCYEQRMDGHYAADDLTNAFLINGKIPNIEFPTMYSETDECEQEYFAHIDYDKRILYTSWYDPKDCLSLSDDEIINDFLGDDDNTKELVSIKDDWKNQISNIKKLEKQGWSFVFDTFECPDEYNCINSPKNKEKRIDEMKLVLNAADSFLRTLDNLSDKEDVVIDGENKSRSFPKFFIKLWKNEVLDHEESIDPDRELHWESLATGWAIGKGLKYEDAIDFGLSYTEFDEENNG